MEERNIDAMDAGCWARARAFQLPKDKKNPREQELLALEHDLHDSADTWASDQHRKIAGEGRGEGGRRGEREGWGRGTHHDWTLLASWGLGRGARGPYLGFWRALGHCSEPLCPLSREAPLGPWGIRDSQLAARDTF